MLAILFQSEEDKQLQDELTMLVERLTVGGNLVTYYLLKNLEVCIIQILCLLRNILCMSLSIYLIFYVR